ncbi:pentatricopeptide repeat-containing-like protein [Cinnamomum micranthum f. kanehirae]|uniref:Pentatricopeptide repeat-containing-like protein n=1 Tax=Cinnamomum micranthum f. kanehirae TaxID=337451 RepID=A0A3S3MI80_9MAGN|nr:pentatricopeptide repeat-containing-like protein [Cinnamomum micranthum f. kanehirae]
MPLFPSGFCLSTPKSFYLSCISKKLSLKCKHYQFRFTVERSYSREQSSITDRFLSLLRTCPNTRSLRKIHALLCTCGFDNNILLGCKLLNCYASFSSLADAKWVFDKIINRNLSLWNSAIIAYFRAGYFCEVLRLYSTLKERGIGVDSLAINFALKSCIELQSVEFGRAIHGDCVKLMLNVERFVGSSLVGLYSKCGVCIEDAQRVFDEMTDRDVVAYTAMVTGYSQLSDYRAKEAFGIAREMQKEGVDPNRVTLVSLLQAASQLEALLEGKSIHAHAIRRGCDHNDEILETSLIDMYMKCDAPHMAESVFDRKVNRTVASWNVMIAGLVRSGQAAEALELFCLMKCDDDIRPDSVLLANALLGCSVLKWIHLGASIHGCGIRAGVHLDVVATTTLIDMYAKCNRINEARELFNEMEAKDVISFNVMISGYLQSGLVDEAFEIFGGLVEAGIRPNPVTMLSMLSILNMYVKCSKIDNAKEVFNRIINKDLVSWTSIMMGYVHHGLADETLAIFYLMRGAGEEPDSVTLLCLLQAFSHLGCLKQTREVHGYVNRNHMERDAVVINSLVITYAKCGRLDMAEVLFSNTIGRGLTSWNTMIASYGMHGNCTEALSLFHQMIAEKVEPDELTFTSLLSACSHAGLVEEGRHVFHSMTAEHFITPCEEHYACMVDLLGRAGCLKEAYDVVKFLPLEGNASAWSALLAACRVHGNTQLGEIVGSKLLDMETASTGAYTLLSSIYAEAGKWSEVEKIQGMVKQKGLRKTPGYSLIELGKATHGM